MPTLPPYANTPLVARASIGNEAYWSLELINRIAVKNVTLDDAANTLRSSLDWVDEVFPMIETSLAGDSLDR